MKKVFLVLSVLALLLSCEKDNVLYYNNQTIGNFVNGRFTTDEGLIYNFVENGDIEGLDTIKRAYILCDILSKVSDNEYDVRLHQLYRVLAKNYLVDSQIEDQAAIGEDPVNINYAWFSNNYINLNLGFTFVEGSTKPHLINLVYDELKSSADTLQFNLRHNAYGEVFGQYKGDSSLLLSNSIVSFPISELIDDNKSKVVVRVNYTWHLTAAGSMVTATEKKHITGVLNFSKK